MIRRFLPLGLVLLAACGRQDTQGLGQNGNDIGMVAQDAAIGDVIGDGDLGVEGDGSVFRDAEIPDESVPDVLFGIDTGTGPDVDPPDVALGDTPVGDVPTSTQSDAAIDPDAAISDTGANDAGQPPECFVDQDCPGFGNFCDPLSGTCVECWNDMHCPGPRICDEQNGNVCRPNCFNGQCGPNAVCDPAINACVECLSDTDCDADESCRLSDRTCVECLSNAECSDEVARPICDTSAGECVGCRNDADCGAGRICEPNVHECVSPNARALCEPCDDDAQCGGNGNLCIGILTAGGFVDRSCALDCSNASCPSGFDCVTVRQTERQCRPSYAMQRPTCTAVRRLGLSCPFSASEPDPSCGLENVQDARCILDTATGSGVCVIWCADQSDCPAGFTCTGASPGQVGVCL